MSTSSSKSWEIVKWDAAPCSLNDSITKHRKVAFNFIWHQYGALCDKRAYTGDVESKHGTGEQKSLTEMEAKFCVHRGLNSTYPWQKGWDSIKFGNHTPRDFTVIITLKKTHKQTTLTATDGKSHTPAPCLEHLFETPVSFVPPVDSKQQRYGTQQR